ncbi:hypothetical protein NEOLI_000857 [Neolecta irregularis DAH-3]|uniref:Uncharacterized protein n=1 Tax=Neolecta irregularis (strain DAH-3) TaxID=1198029 RepID=A0A1U7LKU0_NEOID|nr:hypothetical protein NEOLI_000857 [Neolecta irregularis DAH-3]|eukprot:OLL23267.1 hypothetical protein NEOLI_000857 [Neolecta irregularis DAH-3]
MYAPLLLVLPLASAQIYSPWTTVVGATVTLGLEPQPTGDPIPIVIHPTEISGSTVFVAIGQSTVEFPTETSNPTQVSESLVPLPSGTVSSSGSIQSRVTGLVNPFSPTTLLTLTTPIYENFTAFKNDSVASSTTTPSAVESISSSSTPTSTLQFPLKNTAVTAHTLSAGLIVGLILFVATLL